MNSHSNPHTQRASARVFGFSNVCSINDNQYNRLDTPIMSNISHALMALIPSVDTVRMFPALPMHRDEHENACIRAITDGDCPRQHDYIKLELNGDSTPSGLIKSVERILATVYTVTTYDGETYDAVAGRDFDYSHIAE